MTDSAPVSCNFVGNNKMKGLKKALGEAREIKNPELDLVERAIVSFDELPGLSKLLTIHVF